MSNLEFEVVDARDCSSEQKKYGMMASFNLNIKVDGVTILNVKDLKVQKNKKGSGTFISSPSRKFKRSDGTEGWVNFIELFPGSEDKSAQTAIIDQVRRIVESGDSRPPTKPAARPAPTTNTSERW